MIDWLSDCTQVLFVAFDKAWILGAVLCKLLLYGQIVTLACTTFILTSMSLDRYRVSFQLFLINHTRPVSYVYHPTKGRRLS